MVQFLTNSSDCSAVNKPNPLRSFLSEPSLQLLLLSAADDCRKLQRRRTSLFNGHLLNVTSSDGGRQSLLPNKVENGENLWPNAIVRQNRRLSTPAATLPVVDEVALAEEFTADINHRDHVNLDELVPESEINHYRVSPVFESPTHCATAGAFTSVDHDSKPSAPDSVTTFEISTDNDRYAPYFLPTACGILGERSLNSSSELEFVDNRWSLAVLIAAIVTVLITTGLTFSMGIYFAYFEAEFRASQSQVSVVYGIMGTMMLTYPLSNWLVESSLTVGNGHGVAAIPGGVIASAGFLASAFAQHLWQLYFLLGVTFFGFGLLYPPAFTIIDHFFKRRKYFATATLTTALAVGISIFPPVLTTTANLYGWRGSFFINSVIMVCVSSCGVVYLLAWRSKRMFEREKFLLSSVSTLNELTLNGNTSTPSQLRHSNNVSTSTFGFYNKMFEHESPSLTPIPPPRKLETHNILTKPVSYQATGEELSIPIATIIKRPSPTRKLQKTKSTIANGLQQTTVPILRLLTPKQAGAHLNSTSSEMALRATWNNAKTPIRHSGRDHRSIKPSIARLFENPLFVLVIIHAFFGSSTDIFLTYVIRLYESNFSLTTTKISDIRFRASLLLSLFGVGAVISRLVIVAINYWFAQHDLCQSRIKIVQASATFLAIAFFLVPSVNSSFAVLLCFACVAGVACGFVINTMVGVLAELFGHEMLPTTLGACLFACGSSRCVMVPLSGILIDYSAYESTTATNPTTTIATVNNSSDQNQVGGNFSTAFYLAGVSQVIGLLALLAVDFKRRKL